MPTLALNNFFAGHLAWPTPDARASQIDLQWVILGSKAVHNALPDHVHLSTQVIGGMPLELMQTAGLREGYPGIGQDEIDVAWRSATEQVISTYPSFNEIELTPCNTEFMKQVLPWFNNPGGSSAFFSRSSRALRAR
jgi:hypothetical protein